MVEFSVVLSLKRTSGKKNYQNAYEIETSSVGGISLTRQKSFL